MYSPIRAVEHTTHVRRRFSRRCLQSVARRLRACSAHALAQITLHTPLLYSRAARRGPAAAACSAGLELPEHLLGPLV